MAALPVPAGAAATDPAVHGPVPDTFITAVQRSWMVPAPVKTTEPSPVEVACLVEKSFLWSDHDRAQECVRICHKHPLLWQEFLIQEKVEKKNRERNTKRAREAVNAAEARDQQILARQRVHEREARHLAQQ